MNGMRRLFAQASGSATATTVEQPLNVSIPNYDQKSLSNNGTSWSPQIPNSASNAMRSIQTPSPPPSKYSNFNQSNSPSSSSRLPARQDSNPFQLDDIGITSRSASRSARRKPSTSGHSKASSSLSRSLAYTSGSPPLPDGVPAAPVNTKDELIIELLASEAIVDSRNCEILGSDQVDHLKKELKSLSTRLTAAAKRLTLETRMRDAALSLNKVHSSKSNGTGDNNAALDAANLKVQTAQFTLTKLQEQTNVIQKRLLEHRTAVLAYSLSRLESLVKPAPSNASGVGSSGRTTPANNGMRGGDYAFGGDMSPTSAVTNLSLSSRARFEGAHLFAGHADAKVPNMPKPLRSVAQMAAFEEQFTNVEEQLRAVEAEREELAREAETLRAERSRESAKLVEADTTISGLRSELFRMNSAGKKVRTLEDEKRQWEEQRTRMERELEQLSSRKKEVEREVERELREVKEALERERMEREEERLAREDERMDEAARMQAEIDDLREKEAAAASSRSADVELDMASERLQALIRTHGIQLAPSQRRDMSVMILINALSGHLDSIKDDTRSRRAEKEEWHSTRQRLERELAVANERHDGLSKELEDARREMERLKDAAENHRPIPSKSNSLHSDPGSSNGSGGRSSEDMDRIMSTLRTLWCLLPSRETRAAKTSYARAGSPTSPLRLNNAGGSGSRLGDPPSPSLSDLDVRALKALYDPRSNSPSPIFNTLSNPSDFGIDAFAQRVQALVADDRAIIERLLRFAQAHDLLKNNAERAQKLAQESSMGLETYSKQVKALEERNQMLIGKQTTLLDEIDQLQSAVERAQREKRKFELKAQDQAMTLQNLTDANGTLSARALALAEEVATAPESMRIKMEAQLGEVRRQLREALEEIEAMRGSEQGQKAALLEELNVVQGENTKLREHLRNEQRKNGK